MSVLQQFTSACERPGPLPPPTAMPAATSLSQQLIEQISAPTRATLPWLSESRAFTHHLLLELVPRGFEEPRVFYDDRTTGTLPVVIKGLRAELNNLRAGARTHEQMQVVNGSRASERAGELPYALREISYQETGQDFALRTLEQTYVLEDRSATPAFIKRNRLLGLLLEAQEPLSSAFGEPAVKKLTLVEDDEGSVALFCLVLVPGSLDEARQALNAFDESWWLARSHEAGDKLNFDFELI